jgi:hypothetical protein
MMNLFGGDGGGGNPLLKLGGIGMLGGEDGSLGLLGMLRGQQQQQRQPKRQMGLGDDQRAKMIKMLGLEDEEAFDDGAQGLHQLGLQMMRRDMGL